MKRLWRLLAAGMVLLALTGCSGLSYEELYCLPRATEDYYDLQEALNGVLEDGFNYLAPASGARREPVQLTDLDGDGVDEAVAFFRSADHGNVKVYIFSKSGAVYSPAAVIDGAGSGVASVEYADLDGQGNLELIVTYQVSESVNQALQIYRYSDGEAAGILTAGCSQYTLSDLDSDGLLELLCLTGSGSETPVSVEYYDCQQGELLRAGEQRLRFSYDGLRKVQRGKLSRENRAVLLSGVSSEGMLVTDVLTADENGLRLVTPKENVLTAEPVHSYYVYPEDVDGDGILEVAKPRQLPAYDSGSSAQWIIQWYALEPGGSAEKKQTTYQDFGENWYLTLPEAWDGKLTIKAADVSTTVSLVSFYRKESGMAPEEILTIYTLQGAGRKAYAEEQALTILFSDSETIYAVALNAEAEPWEGTVSMAQVSEMFRFSDQQRDDETKNG